MKQLIITTKCFEI